MYLRLAFFYQTELEDESISNLPSHQFSTIPFRQNRKLPKTSHCWLHAYGVPAADWLPAHLRQKGRSGVSSDDGGASRGSTSHFTPGSIFLSRSLFFFACCSVFLLFKLDVALRRQTLFTCWGRGICISAAMKSSILKEN